MKEGSFVGRVGTIRPLTEAPAEALRLLDEWRVSLDSLAPEIRDWILPGLQTLSGEVRSGTATGGLWVGPKDEAVGLASWTLPAEVGLRIGPYLSTEFRSSAGLHAFVQALDRVAPVRIVDEPIPGCSTETIGRALGPLGFAPIQRVDMRFPDAAALPEVPDDPALPVRSLRVEDERAIGELLARAYADSRVERTLFARFRDPLADALEGAREILHGEVGVWRPDASFGVEMDGRLVAATLVNDHHGPLLSEVVTDPSWRRRALARRLLHASVRAVRSLGLGVPRLVVTVGNERAHRVYRAFGFVEDRATFGTLWMRIPGP